MTESIHKKNIELAFKEKEFIKIVYFYEDQNKKFFTIRGIILDLADDGFIIEDIKDGKIARSFDHIVETRVSCMGDSS